MNNFNNLWGTEVALVLGPGVSRAEALLTQVQSLINEVVVVVSCCTGWFAEERDTPEGAVCYL